MDRHVQQRPATVVLAALVIFSINTFSLVGSDDGLDITTIQVKKKTYQLPNLLGQQIVILVGLDINPNQVGEQSAADNLIYGIAKPSDTVSAGINEDYSCLVTSNRDRGIFLFFKTDKKKVMIKYANHSEKLHTKTVPLSRLVEQSYRIKKQRQQVSKYASTLRIEWLVRCRKLEP